MSAIKIKKAVSKKKRLKELKGAIHALQAITEVQGRGDIGKPPSFTGSHPLALPIPVAGEGDA